MFFNLRPCAPLRTVQMSYGVDLGAISWSECQWISAPRTLRQLQTLVATIRVNEMNVFAWVEWMSEAFDRDSQVNRWMDKNEPSCFRNDKRPRNQGFKKPAEISHGSATPLWFRRNTVNQVFLYPWRQELPNPDNFLNPRLSGLWSFPDCCWKEKNAVNEEESSEPFADEWRKVNGGH